MADQDLERLRGHRLFLGTPMYDGRCCSEYALAIAQLAALCTQLGIALRFHFACHEALITRARNATVDAFLRTEDDTLLFVDADIGFDPRDAVRMLALQVADPAMDVVAAPYPRKRLAWESVRSAAKAGLADADPGDLERYASAIAIHPARTGPFAADAPLEVTMAGTGFMMIRRETFARCSVPTYRPESAGLDEHASPEVHAFFETGIDSREGNLAIEIKAWLARFPEATPAEVLAFLESGEASGDYSGKYVSEDYAFCRTVRAAGMRVWLCPWMELSHTGSHSFTSRLIDLAAIGAL